MDNEALTVHYQKKRGSIVKQIESSTPYYKHSRCKYGTAVREGEVGQKTRYAQIHRAARIKLINATNTA